MAEARQEQASQEDESMRPAKKRRTVEDTTTLCKEQAGLATSPEWASIEALEAPVVVEGESEPCDIAAAAEGEAIHLDGFVISSSSGPPQA